VVDVDSQEAYDFLQDKLPSTLTIKTGSNESYKKHYYYYSDDNTASFVVRDLQGNTLVEIRGGDNEKGKGKGVLAPGSIHPDGNIYEIEKESPIASIEYD